MWGRPGNEASKFKLMLSAKTSTKKPYKTTGVQWAYSGASLEYYNIGITIHQSIVVVFLLARVTTLPSVKYSKQVEVDVIESRLGQGEIGHEPAWHENNN